MKPLAYEYNSVLGSEMSNAVTQERCVPNFSGISFWKCATSLSVISQNIREDYKDKIQAWKKHVQKPVDFCLESFENNSENYFNLSFHEIPTLIDFAVADYSSAERIYSTEALESAIAKIEKNKAEIYPECLSVLQDNDPISGQVSLAERFMLEHTEASSIKIVNQVLLQIYHDYCGDEHIVSGILQMFSCVPYDNVMPEAGVMLMGLLAHKNTNLQDNAIQLFEHWNSKKCLCLLKSAKCNEVWLEKYLKDVIEYIEKEGDD